MPVGHWMVVTLGLTAPTGQSKTIAAKVQRWQPRQVVAIVRRGEHKESAALMPHLCFAESHRDALLNACSSDIRDSMTFNR